jgi:hypothetical protein
MIDEIKLGSKWTTSDMNEFVVLGILEDTSGIWVHYRTNKKENNTEYSCLKESFLHRFSPKVD